MQGKTLVTYFSAEGKTAAVAKAIGVSVSALAMYENGARIPRDETKRRIAEHYGRSVGEIFFE